MKRVSGSSVSGGSFLDVIAEALLVPENVKKITINIAGVTLGLTLNYRETESYSEHFSVDAAPDIAVPPVNEEEWGALENNDFERSGQTELSYLSGKCSDALLDQGICLIHAAAVRFQDRAYLFAAAPGVGKSTQVKTLMELYPGEFSVICGDRPALRLEADGSVTVHPTPWNGKEGWGGAPSAPLEAVFFLKRGEQTAFRQLSVRKAVIPTWEALIQTSITEEKIRCAADFASVLLKSVPTWEYINGGIPDSCRILYDQLLRRK